MRKFYKDKGEDIMGKAYNHPLYRDYTNSETNFIRNYVKRGKLLDVGVGYGKSLVPLLKRDIDIYGIDINEGIIKNAQNLLGKKVKIKLADAHDLPYKDNSFEHVICMGATFGNFENPDMCLDEMLRVVKPEGEVILGVYSSAALKTQLQTYKEIGLAIEKYDDEAVYTKESLISRRFTREKIEDIARQHRAQIEIIELTPISYIAILRKIKPTAQ